MYSGRSLGQIGLCTLLMVSVAASTGDNAHGEVPRVINYQGRLTEMDKTPINGEVVLTFGIYDDQEAVLWTETDTVQVDNGLFDVVLGAENPIPDTVFNGPLRYLGIQPDGQPEIVPRAQLVSVPYAYWALRTDTAEYALSGSGIGTSWDWSDSSSHGPDSVLYADTAAYTLGLAPNIVAGGNVIDSSLFAVDVGDEAGLSRYYNDTLGVTVTYLNWVTVGQQSIKCPTSGYIVALGYATLSIAHVVDTGLQVLMGFQNIPDADVMWPRAQFQVPAAYPTGVIEFPMNVMAFIPIATSGEYTYYLNAVSSGDPGSEYVASNVQIVLLFFPTAYGTVDAIY